MTLGRTPNEAASAPVDFYVQFGAKFRLLAGRRSPANAANLLEPPAGESIKRPSKDGANLVGRLGQNGIPEDFHSKRKP